MPTIGGGDDFVWIGGPDEGLWLLVVEYVTNIWDRNSCVRGNPPLRSGLRSRATRQAPFSRLPHAAS